MGVKTTFSTRIGEFDVPVIDGAASLVRFEDGDFAFWTAVFKKKVGKRWRVWGRARVGLSAGDRFDRMKRECRAAHIPKEDRPEYRRMWEMLGRGANVKCVRPSTDREVKRWIDKHPEQAKQRVA